VSGPRVDGTWDELPNNTKDEKFYCMSDWLELKGRSG
jgi:hypothetical protein